MRGGDGDVEIAEGNVVESGVVFAYRRGSVFKGELDLT